MRLRLAIQETLTGILAVRPPTSLSSGMKNKAKWLSR